MTARVGGWRIGSGGCAAVIVNCKGHSDLSVMHRSHRAIPIYASSWKRNERPRSTDGQAHVRFSSLFRLDLKRRAPFNPSEQHPVS